MQLYLHIIYITLVLRLTVNFCLRTSIENHIQLLPHTRTHTFVNINNNTNNDAFIFRIGVRAKDASYFFLPFYLYCVPKNKREENGIK